MKDEGTRNTGLALWQSPDPFGGRQESLRVSFVGWCKSVSITTENPSMESTLQCQQSGNVKKVAEDVNFRHQEDIGTDSFTAHNSHRQLGSSAGLGQERPTARHTNTQIRMSGRGSIRRSDK